ncbi:3-phosphoshikimate 1-carboxyvinyltransferase [Alkalibacillus aidingensis]|uniref:3-phosphoshikimate 1-carboxyvinyltransferase n=1 Tax=Alkalibacillus aidingensis TaxID=2747607 RepID=UPI0016613307|nr:3-phosphoshikimate 1-carboxyvinyltransferase [Alkalibacillus aidingensis]
MEEVHFKNQPLIGELQVPGDKSISHRAIMLGALANGTTKVDNFLTSEDCMRTVEAFKELGVDIEVDKTLVTIKSKGYYSFQQPNQPLNMGNSGTTTRLISGILAGLPFETELIGDASLSQRPMGRVIDPLTKMGADFITSNNRMTLPLTVKGGTLKPINYHLPVDSAQVKSAILLSGLLTDGQTTVFERNQTRNHTEKMLSAFGGEVEVNNDQISIAGPQQLSGAELTVPGDASSAAFWIAAAVITPGSHILIQNVGLNQTRTGLVDVLKRMGAKISLQVTGYIGDEPIGNIEVNYSKLQPTTLESSEIPSLIDEIPLLALVATQAQGTMEINNIEELRYKETDRIETTVQILKSLGANIDSKNDTMTVNGKVNLTGGRVRTNGDHRMAMMAAIASTISDHPIEIDDVTCINISYPSFFDHFKQLLSRES